MIIHKKSVKYIWHDDSDKRYHAWVDKGSLQESETMTIIHLTQKLQKEIGIKPAALVRVEESDEPFDEWYAHVFFVNRKKHVIFVERQTLFSFVLPGVSRKDLRERLPELFERGLSKALFYEEASGKVVKAVMEACRGEMRLAKTQNRQMIAATTEFIRHYKWSIEDEYSSLEADQSNRRLPMGCFPEKTWKFKLPIRVFAEIVSEKFHLDFKPVREAVIEDEFVWMKDCVFDKQTSRAMAYVFDVRMVVNEGDALHGTAREVIREIAIAGDQSLADLAAAILWTFDFECDHCFGFYSNLKRGRLSDSDEVYELFVDCPDVEPSCPHAQSVEKTRVEDVFRDFGKQMLFLFDYGEAWEFCVTFVAHYSPQAGQKLPCLLRSVGNAPEQYPDYDL